MKNCVYLAVFLVLAMGGLGSRASAQQSLTTTTTSISYAFDTFAASGFDPAPAAGQLDSDEWRVLGMSEGDLAWGGTGADGSDYGRGTSNGGVSSGGVYAFDVDNIPVAMMTDFALGAQSTADDFSPGSFQLRVNNGTGRTLRAIQLAFQLHYRNDQPRSTRMTVRVIRESDLAEITLATLQRDTPEAAATVPSWVSVPLNTLVDLDALEIADGGNFIVSFDFDDLAGSGSRDEIALDDVTVIVPDCGNGVTDGGETCDDGDIVTETACPYGTATCMTCNATCTMVLNLTGAACGDGTTDTSDGEACDDGNTATETECAYGTMSCMACDATCASVLTLSGRFCGDGTTDTSDSEVCDDGNTTTETECAYGTMSCMACDATCATSLSLSGRYCGDGTTDTGDGETCDDSNTTDGDGCSSTCAIEVDGGMPDAGMPDAGPSDAGAVDAGAVDAGAVDAGGGDAGVDVDAGMVDVDAGPIAMDAGTDAGASDDAAVSADAMAPTTDAGPGVDAGTPVDDGGCGCSAPGRRGSHGPIALAMIVGALVLRRRRR